MQNNIKNIINKLENNIKGLQQEGEDDVYYFLEEYQSAINQIKEIVK